MERKLATIQEIERLDPIPGADVILAAKAKNLGWVSCIKKDEFKIGDKCVFLEIDALLDPKISWVQEYASFMEKYKWRVRSIKLKKQICQGLFLPISVLPSLKDMSSGENVTDLLGITKYEPPLPKGYTNIIGEWPARLISKTDESRIQSYPELIEEFHGKACYATVKYDGESCTIVHKDGEFWCCSRNWRIGAPKEDKNSRADDFWNTLEKHREALAQLGNVAIQGELCGPGRAKNKIGIPRTEFFVFTVKDLDNGKDWNFTELYSAKLETIGIKQVPIAYEFIFDKEVHKQEKLLEMAKGRYPGTKNHREGIVIRPKNPCFSPALQGRLSVKVINNDFLLGEE